MKKLFVVLTVFALLVIGLGFYRGWFGLSSPSSDVGSNKVNINLTLDPDQVKADAETVKEKAAELTGQATEGVHDLVDQPSDSK